MFRIFLLMLALSLLPVSSMAEAPLTFAEDLSVLYTWPENVNPEEASYIYRAVYPQIAGESSLALIADKIGLGQHLLLGHGEDRLGGRNRASILADAVESVIAASFLDGGMAAAEGFIRSFVLTNVPVKRMQNTDYKTTLQELVQQKKNQVLTYVLTGESGPDHDKVFCVDVLLNDQCVGSGTGSSKKRAEQAAAQSALQALSSENV